MAPSADYPRMMFHRSEEPVIVKSAEEEEALGPEWFRTVLPPEPAPAHVKAPEKRKR